jgi:excinuclease Cho
MGKPRSTIQKGCISGAGTVGLSMGTDAQAHVAHLREQAMALPSAPGVYFFHGEGSWPLYIGKSVNIRTRVLSHLRAADELRMLLQTQRFAHQLTAGPLGALLLEAQLIKAQQPLFNQRLRRMRQLCAWHWTAQERLELVSAQHIDFAQTPRLFGLYASRHSAMEGLRALAEQHRLCEVALGLEKAQRGRACFRFMLKQCLGVCCGKESPEAHHRRLLLALQDTAVHTWPVHGAVALQETAREPLPTQPAEQWHVVNNWCYLGSVSSLKEAQALVQVAPHFDVDSYHILCQSVMTQALPMVALSPAPQ